MFLLVCQLGEISTFQDFLLVAVVSIVTVLALAAVVPAEVSITFTCSVEESIGPVTTVIILLELLVIAVATIPLANCQVLAFSSVSIATTWRTEAFWDGTTFFVLQAFKVYTSFGKLPLGQR